MASINPSFATIIWQFPRAVSNYRMSSVTNALEESDKKLLLSWIVSERSKMLSLQLKQTIYPNLAIQRFSFAPLGIAILSQVVATRLTKFLEKKLTENEGQENYALSTAHYIAQKVSKSGTLVLNHSDLLLNTACCVSYVAMIAMGFPITGGAGLAGLALIVIKRQGWLPPQIDFYLKPASALCSSITAFTTPVSPLSKILVLINLAQIFNNYFQQYLPKRLVYPKPGTHVIDEESQNVLSRKNEDRLSEICSTQKNFCLNTSSIFAKEVYEVFPYTQEPNNEEINGEGLIRQIKEKMLSENILLTDEEREGFVKLEIMLVYGLIDNRHPQHLENFQHALYNLLHSALQDGEFEERIRELTSIVGSHSSDKWLREITLFFHQEPRNYRSAIHQELAKYRGRIVESVVTKIFQEAGEKNNHLPVNAFQAAIWPCFSTHEGTFYYETHEMGLISRLALFLPEIATRVCLGPMKVFLIDPEIMQKPVKTMETFDKLLERKNDYGSPLFVAHRVLDAIKPQYNDTNEPQRNIPWETITEWFIEAEERLNILFGSENNWNGDWVNLDENEEPYLTRQGVHLLLWDLGILQLTPDFYKEEI